ncbi:MAG: transposase [Chloroflexi bacterium]|nr:transposase [Chloroflexota bacterium]MCI0579755.1 transposase [Chloroflexota bacterium]MCI0648318.1 transposase [Chloroflexota bacterium]MCI0726560.1 transposase [Chloroflexota bacterium]
MNQQPLLQQFRDAVYQRMAKRADATMDLIDALTVAGHVESPVALSEEGPFRRQFSSVYDALENGEVEAAALGDLFYAWQPADSETIAGYEVYAVDVTPNERPEAETLPERLLLKSDKNEPTRVGWKFSWLVRLVKAGTSWVAPWDVRRVRSELSDNQTATEQVQALDGCSRRQKVVVADSLYGNHVFLAIFLLVTTVYALVRLRHNLTLYERPVPKPPGSHGAPRKHGPRFKLSAPSRPPDRQATFWLGGQEIRLAAWYGLHLRKLPTLVGLVLRVEFLKSDGTPRYQRPMWLFWTGPTTVPLADLCRMYLWRFAIEHAFRFLKQRLGLNANQSTNPATAERWMWLCALAYWQLLLMAPDVQDLRPAWHQRPTAAQGKPLTPGQVQRGALRFLCKLGTPAAPPRPVGKGAGRPKGYRPQPRTRFAIVRKGQKTARTVKNTPVAVV